MVYPVAPLDDALRRVPYLQKANAWPRSLAQATGRLSEAHQTGPRSPRSPALSTAPTCFRPCRGAPGLARASGRGLLAPNDIGRTSTTPRSCNSTTSSCSSCRSAWVARQHHPSLFGKIGHGAPYPGMFEPSEALAALPSDRSPRKYDAVVAGGPRLQRRLPPGPAISFAQAIAITMHYAPAVHRCTRDMGRTARGRSGRSCTPLQNVSWAARRA